MRVELSDTSFYVLEMRVMTMLKSASVLTNPTNNVSFIADYRSERTLGSNRSIFVDAPDLTSDDDSLEGITGVPKAVWDKPAPHRRVGNVIYLF